MNNARRILATVLQRILNRPENWTKGTLARTNSNGYHGQCFCALGAINKAREELGLSSADETQAQSLLTTALNGRAIASFNDDAKTEFKDVACAFAKATVL